MDSVYTVTQSADIVRVLDACIKASILSLRELLVFKNYLLLELSGIRLWWCGCYTDITLLSLLFVGFSTGCMHLTILL